MKHKKTMFLIISYLILNTQIVLPQQALVKSWGGTLITGMGGKLRVVINITQNEKGNLAALLDSPDQGVNGIPVDSVILENNKIKLIVSSIKGEFEGVINDQFIQIDGEWKQAGQSLPLILKPIIPSKNEPEYFVMWQGILQAGDAKLRMVFKFYKNEMDSIGVSLDIPEQRAKDISASTVHNDDDSIYIRFNQMDAYYIGKFNSRKTSIKGKWFQSGSNFDLVLEKIDKVEEVKHPQEPKGPFPYNEEEVVFENKTAGINLAGTFTYPKEIYNIKGFPAVVLVTGSGPQTRDEEVFGHKTFLVWSDYLTRNGIAVLRYDDRGIGKSKGNFNSATTMDFSTDAIAAIKYLKSRKEVNPEKLGIIGHSEGGLIAPIAANRCKDVSFIVLAAGPAVPGDEIVLLQSELILQKTGAPEEIIKNNNNSNKKIFDIIKNSKDSLEASGKLDHYFNDIYNSLSDSEKNRSEYSKESNEQKKKRFLSPWFRQFIMIDPRNELVRLDMPVLAMYGENDLQVPPSQNKDEMEKVLAKSRSKYFKVVVLPGLNHIFQESESGLPTEYGNIEQTASPKMLELMTDWIKGL